MAQLRIKELCKARGVTIVELANRVSMTRESISNMIAGRQSPPLSTLEKIADVLGCGIVELFAPKNDFIAFVRSEGKTHTITSKEELKEFADSLNAPKMCQEETQETQAEESEPQGK